MEQGDISFSAHQDDITLIGSQDDTLVDLDDEGTFTLDDTKEVFSNLGISQVRKGVQEQQLVEQEDSDQAAEALFYAADSISSILGAETHGPHTATYNHQAVQTGSENAIVDLPKDSMINYHIDTINANLKSLHALDCTGRFIVEEDGRFSFVRDDEHGLPRPAIVLEKVKAVEIEGVYEEIDEETKSIEEIVEEIEEVIEWTKDVVEEIKQTNKELEEIKMADEEIEKANKPTVVSAIEETIKAAYHAPDVFRIADDVQHPKKPTEAPTHLPMTSQAVISDTTTQKHSCSTQQQNKIFTTPWHAGTNIKFKERQLVYVLENSAWLFYVPRHGGTIWPPKSAWESDKVEAPKIVVTDTDAPVDKVKPSERLKDVEAASIAPNVAAACPAELVVLEATPTPPARVEGKPLAIVTRSPSPPITLPRELECAPSKSQKVYSRREKENRPPRMQTPPTPPFTPKCAHLYTQNYYLPVVNTKSSPARVREGPLPVPIPKEFDHTMSPSTPVTLVSRRIKPNIPVQ
ncbi:hypothetical protein BDQ12DRAFT_471063 [Crucibulum laeve]|uniref:Uncharacterized protein n=1 Tax=Crucibulum laeve TaxID=68775 RepID=A0A5C3LJA5_9AGAR|nr:hypothetical protein BDQ12DRAFT_471063 [Crucibulum laeve]